MSAAGSLVITWSDDFSKVYFHITEKYLVENRFENWCYILKVWMFLYSWQLWFSSWNLISVLVVPHDLFWSAPVMQNFPSHKVLWLWGNLTTHTRLLERKWRAAVNERRESHRFNAGICAGLVAFSKIPGFTSISVTCILSIFSFSSGWNSRSSFPKATTPWFTLIFLYKWYYDSSKQIKS